MKPIGSLVSLRWRWWYAQELPHAGDHLVTSTGRRYLIVGVEGKRLECIVIDKDKRPDAGALEFSWSWAKREKIR